MRVGATALLRRCRRAVRDAYLEIWGSCDMASHGGKLGAVRANPAVFAWRWLGLDTDYPMRYEEALSPPRLSNALSRHLISVSPSKGLVRKQIAPAAIARARMFSSG
jgi:hypothetical protein